MQVMGILIANFFNKDSTQESKIVDMEKRSIPEFDSKAKFRDVFVCEACYGSHSKFIRLKMVGFP